MARRPLPAIPPLANLTRGADERVTDAMIQLETFLRSIIPATFQGQPAIHGTEHLSTGSDPIPGLDVGSEEWLGWFNL